MTFITIFNNINLVRKDNNGNIVQKNESAIKLHNPKQKFLTRLDQDANLDPKVAITLPRLGFEIQNLEHMTLLEN